MLSPRLPSASQARIGGNLLGWWSAIVFTLSLQVFLHGKAAVADMWLVLFMTTAHWAGYELIARPPKQTSNIQTQAFPRWWWVFYVSLALAFLAKGPIGFIPILTIAAIKWQDRQL